jgi:hypothetical protein
MTASAEGMADLRSCPFCGGEVELSSAWFRKDGLQFWIECKCGASIPGIGETLSREACVAAWNRRANPWVSVAERLPEEGVKVLVWRKNEAMVGQRNGEYWVLTPGVWTCRDVTHWMPIPPLTPKEERG